MLKFLNHCAGGRSAWLLLALVAFLLESTALYIQHVMLLKPCVLCIYERCALLGVLVAGLLGGITSSKLMRYLALLLLFYSTYKGLLLTYEHNMLSWSPNVFSVCPLMASFPAGLPLDKWLPTVFAAGGDCAGQNWSFLSLSMPEWLFIVFIVYLIVCFLLLLGLLFKPKRRELFMR